MEITSSNQSHSSGVKAAVAPKPTSQKQEWGLSIATAVLVGLMVVPQASALLDKVIPIPTFSSISSANGNTIAQKALAHVGKDVKPGMPFQCAVFVRSVLQEVETNIPVTHVPYDEGKQENNGTSMARSFFGSDVGTLITDPSQLQPGDLVGFQNTYGNFHAWGDNSCRYCCRSGVNGSPP